MARHRRRGNAVRVWGLYLTDVIWEGADDSRFETGLLRSDFWHGWWDVVSFLLRFPQEQSAVSFLAIGLGVLGVVVAPRGVPRATLVGLAVGYALFVLAFANYTSTHLLLAPAHPDPLARDRRPRRLGARLLEGRRVLQGAVVAMIAAAVAVAAQRAYTRSRRRLRPTGSPPTARSASSRATTRSIIIDRQLGQPAMYWGWIATRAWEIDYLEQPPAWSSPTRPTT